MAFNLENMTVDYKKMFRMIPTDRAALAQSGAISDLISSLTPGQLVNLFPRYYRDRLPDVGKAVGSLGGALSGGTDLSGGRSQDGTSSPVTTTSVDGTPAKSPSAEEKAVQELLQEAKVGQYADLPEGKIGLYRPAYSLTDADLSDEVIRTIAGEARLSSKEGVDAVINVMLNRVGSDQYGSNLLEVASQGQGTGGIQFEGFNKGKVSKDQAEYIRQRIKVLASGAAPDNTFGANEFRGDYYVYGEGRGKAFYRDAERQGFVNIGGNIFAARGNYSGPYQGYDQTEVQEKLKQIEIENAATGIQDLESLQPFDPAMIGQLEERLQKWYEKAEGVQKKNFELALQKLGVEEFNETMKKQPVNNTTIQSMSTQVIEGNFIDSPAFVDQGGGVRNLPIPAHVKEKLIYAQERSGIAKVVSISSGQIPWEEAEAMGARVNDEGQWVLPNGEIVGTGAKHRHSTDVGAGDLQFYDKEGNILKNNDSRVLDFMKYSAASGLKGIGAGTHTGEYMGEYTVHVGAGEEGSWGGADPVIDAQLKAGNEMTDSDYLAWKEQKLQAALAGIEQTVAEDAVSDPVAAAQSNMQSPEQQPTSASPLTPAVSDPVAAAQSNMQPSAPPTEPLPPAEIPSVSSTELPVPEIPAVEVPSFSEGGTVEMPPATPGEGLAGVDVKTGEVKFMGNDRELYTQDDNGNLRIDPSTIRREDQKVEMASAEPQRTEPTNQPMQRKPEQPMPLSTPDPNFLETMSSGSMASSPSQLRALNRAKLYGDNSGNLVNGHFS